jgi:hypothetical protein
MRFVLGSTLHTLPVEKFNAKLGIELLDFRSTETTVH